MRRMGARPRGAYGRASFITVHVEEGRARTILVDVERHPSSSVERHGGRPRAPGGGHGVVGQVAARVAMVRRAGSHGACGPRKGEEDKVGRVGPTIDMWAHM